MVKLQRNTEGEFYLPKTISRTAAKFLFVALIGIGTLPLARTAGAADAIQYKPLPVGTKLTYGPKKETVVVKTNDGLAMTSKASWSDPITRFGNLVQVSGNPFSPLYLDLEIEMDAENREKVKKFWPLKVGTKATYKVMENWATRYWQDWTLVSKVEAIEALKWNGKFYRTVKIVTHGESTENCACSVWSVNGRKFVEKVWIHPGSGVLLKFEREWSGKEVEYGFDSGHIEKRDLINAEFPAGSKVVLAPEDKDKINRDLYLSSLKQQDDKKQAIAKANREREAAKEKKRAVIKAQKQAADHANRLAKIKRLKAEAHRLAELERQRKEDEQITIAIAGDDQRRRQFSVLKKLYSKGLLGKEDFKLQKEALLALFKGSKSANAGKTAPNSTLASVIKSNLAPYSDVNFGKYHALVIGSNDYDYLPKLKTAKADAEEIATILRRFYGFKVKLLTNATRDNILDALDVYRETLTTSDNLLLYYAGHGWLDKEASRGYWLPVDAKSNRRRDWLSTVDITDTLKALNAKHVLVMADSCYSGTLVRGIRVQEHMPDYVRKVAQKRARLVMTSGGLEPVVDSAGGDHSPFASVFLRLLKSNKGVMDGTKMFNKMRRPVMLSADQTPEYSDVRKAGHEGGDFLFVRRR
jgi:hypothetical protein